MANRLWNHFFGTPFVSPLNGFDLARLNVKTAAEYDTTVQPHDPELMECITDCLIDSDLRLRVFLRVILSSELYQLAYQDLPAADAGTVGPYWGGARRVRPIEGEAFMDSISRMADYFPPIISVPYVFDGEEFYHAWSLPNPADPTFSDPNKPEFADALALDENRNYRDYINEIHGILNSFGRAKRDTGLPRPASVRPELALTTLNSTWITELILIKSPIVLDAHAAWTAQRWPTVRVVEEFFWRGLQRQPTPHEIAVIGAHMERVGGLRGVREAMWLVINHPNFILK
jgi:hypothetical protein